MSNIKFTGNFSCTVIDNNFIDNYMAKAPSPVFSLIYIYAYRCAMANISVSNRDIAKMFNVIESDVIKAWRYWQTEGLIKSSGTKEEPLIEFMAVSNKMPYVEEKAEKKEISEKVSKVVVAKPVFNPSDVDVIIRENAEVGELLSVAEIHKGKTLSSKETELVVWMYQSLELPFDVICMLLSFCYKNNKPARYMEKTAIDWVEKGITTSDAADSYLSHYNNYGKVLKLFGVSDRAVSAAEKNHIDRWINEWNLSFELIETAIKRTVENTGKVAFSYCNKILETWYNSGFKTIKDVEEEEAKFLNKGNKNIKNNNNLPQPPKGIFNNYNQRVYSADEINEILKRKGNIQ